MQPLVTILILVSAFLHSLWNAALKRQHDPEAASVVILAIATALGIAAIAFAHGPLFSNGLGLAWAIGEQPGYRQIIGTAGVALGAVLLGWPS